MKKQIIVIASVALAAIILFTSYALFFKDDGIEEVGDPFYTLTEDVKTALSEIEGDCEIQLIGYDGDDDNWERIYLFSNEIASANGDFEVLLNEEPDNEFVGVRVSGNGKNEDILFDAFFKKLFDGTIYAFDGESLIANAILKNFNKEQANVN